MSNTQAGDTSAGRIYAALNQSIILGHRGAGERLSPEELANQYGTSVTPVREALQRLMTEGLVENRPRSGYFVTTVTLKQLRDMLHLREILEVGAVERAALCMSAADLAELESIDGGYTGDDDVACVRYVAANRRLHWLIALASGNHELASVLGHLHDRLTRFFVLIYSGRQMELQHGCLIAALREHNVQRAKECIIAEVRNTRDLLLDEVIEEQGDHWSVNDGSVARRLVLPG